jgi:hypothetical protein
MKGNNMTANERAKNDILEALDEQFSQIRRKASKLLDAVEENAETMDGSSGTQFRGNSLTEYEHVMLSLNDLGKHSSCAISDLCDNIVQFAASVRIDSD